MTTPFSNKKSCKNIDKSDILSLMKKDYLAFCLQYTLDSNTFSVSLSNGIQVSILADGLIAFNLEQQTDTEETKTKKNIVLSCAIHGNETAPIEICQQLVEELLNQHLHTEHRVLFIFGNIPAMHIAERFVEENLNRLFSRKVESNTFEGRRATEIMDTVDTFFTDQNDLRLHYDLHTAIRPSKNEKFAVYPYLHGKKHNKQQLAFLSSCGVNTILLSQSATTTFSYYSSVNHNAHAFTVELGKVKPFGQNDMTRFTQVNDSLRHLIQHNQLELPEFESCPLEIYTVNQVINKQHDDFTLNFDDDTANFTEFAKGHLLAKESGASYFAQYDGEAIVFPNANVSIGQRAILTVIPHEL